MEENKKVGFKKYIQRNIYKWHRIIGIIAIVPTIFWTASGIMHPFMSHWFKTKIANEFYKAETVKVENIQLSLGQVLEHNNITAFKNFRLVKFNEKEYYQVKDTSANLLYISVLDGKINPKGEQELVESMARFMLNDKTSTIKTIEKITNFTDEYPYVNRFLPAYKVAFDRPDEMDIYLDPSQSRFIVFNDYKRKIFVKIFNIFHNWDFLNIIANNTVRIFVMILFLTIIVASALAGLVIYGFMWKKVRPVKNGNQQNMFRKYHRSIGVFTSIVTFAFAFSGMYHATKKLTPDERIKYVSEPIIQTSAVSKATMPDLKGVTNISLVKWSKNIFWQVVKKDWETKETTFEYINIADNQLLSNGNIEYANYLANKFANRESSGGEECCEEMASKSSCKINKAKLLEADLITKFEGEYGFVNKRLPVVKLAYDTPEHTTYYIETTTSRLATKVEDSDRREGFSFAFLHKYNGLEKLGKNFRDGVMAFAALGVLVVSILGLLIFIKIK